MEIPCVFSSGIIGVGDPTNQEAQNSSNGHFRPALSRRPPCLAPRGSAVRQLKLPARLRVERCSMEHESVNRERSGNSRRHTMLPRGLVYRLIR